MLGLPAAATKVGNQSSPETIAVLDFARRDLAGPADDHRSAEAALHACSLASGKRRLAAIGPSEVLGAVIGGKGDDGVVRRGPLSFRYFMTEPTISSSCDMPASDTDQPFSGVRSFSYFSDRCVTTCIRVGLSQRKNGLPSCLALSRNLSALPISRRPPSPCVSDRVRPHLRFSVFRPCPSAAAQWGHPHSVA